jgi:hypothetical protein
MVLRPTKRRLPRFRGIRGNIVGSTCIISSRTVPSQRDALVQDDGTPKGNRASPPGVVLFRTVPGEPAERVGAAANNTSGYPITKSVES